MQALPALPESLCIVEMGGAGDSEMGVVSVGGLFLNIGLQNGVLLRTALDSVTGDLSDTRTRFVIVNKCNSLAKYVLCRKLMAIPHFVYNNFYSVFKCWSYC